MWVIDAAKGDSPWREAWHDDQPDELSIRFRFARTDDGVAVAGIQVDRTDGRALTARDLRAVKLPPNWVLFGETPRRWYGAEGDEITRRQKSSRDDERRHRAVWDLWIQAQVVAPRAPIKWMLPQLGGISYATARRWIAQAKECAELHGWTA